MMRQSNYDLETCRLSAEVGWNDDDMSFSHTVDFFGLIMEKVRSGLARGLRQGYDKKDEYRNRRQNWRPRIFNDDQLFLKATLQNSFTLSEGLCAQIASWCNGSIDRAERFLNERSIQVRVLWELQEAYVKNLPHQISRNNMDAMITAMLAFPSLTCDIKILASSDTSMEDTEVHFSTLKIIIRTIGGPQDLSIHVTFSKQNGALFQLSDVQLHRKSPSRDDCFEWEGWRDAFSGRLKAYREWRIAHGIGTLTEYTTTNGIETGLQTIFLLGEHDNDIISTMIWEGWLPNKPRFCCFEFEELKKADPACPWFKVALIELIIKLEYMKFPILTRIRKKFIFKDLIKDYLKKIKENFEPKRSQHVKYKHQINETLDIFELFALGGNVEALNTAVSLLMEWDVVTNRNRALRLLEMFPLESLSQNEQKNAEKSISEQFKNLGDALDYDAGTVLRFAAFQRRLLAKGRIVNGQTVMDMLRKSYLSKQNPEILDEIIRMNAACQDGSTGESSIMCRKISAKTKASGIDGAPWLSGTIYCQKMQLINRLDMSHWRPFLLPSCLDQEETTCISVMLNLWKTHLFDYEELENAFVMHLKQPKYPIELQNLFQENDVDKKFGLKLEELMREKLDEWIVQVMMFSKIQKRSRSICSIFKCKVGQIISDFMLKEDCSNSSEEDYQNYIQQKWAIVNIARLLGYMHETYQKFDKFGIDQCSKYRNTAEKYERLK